MFSLTRYIRIHDFIWSVKKHVKYWGVIVPKLRRNFNSQGINEKGVHKTPASPPGSSWRDALIIWAIMILLETSAGRGG